MTRSEVIETFSDVLPDIEKALRQNWRHELAQIKRPRAKQYNRFLVQSWLYICEQENVTQKYKPMLRMIEMHNQPKTPDMIEQLDIERAKEYPIEDLLPEPPVRRMARCPLHNDKTPSFQIKKNNKYTCYGCGEFGDSIDLYQKLHNVTFVEAVKALK